jgi:glycogen operon protein
VLSRVKLVAEPWDVGADGYQLGNFPPGWSEWNGRYRDDLRSYWRGDDGSIPGVARSMLGSAGLFQRRGRRPWSSINFITSHDGFTLADLFAYNDKHNEANGEYNKDGHDDNRSWNCGIEGSTDDPDVLDLRMRLRRAALMMLLLSHGVPMLLMGDEIGRSQGGNNNAYCQDNEISWVDWSRVHERDEELFAFVAGLIRIRQRWPQLKAARYMHGERLTRDGLRNVAWQKPDGSEMRKADWENGFARVLGMTIASTETLPLFIAMNAHHEPIEMKTPALAAVSAWRCLACSARGVIDPDDPLIAAGQRYLQPERAIRLFEGRFG